MFGQYWKDVNSWNLLRNPARLMGKWFSIQQRSERLTCTEWRGWDWESPECLKLVDCLSHTEPSIPRPHPQSPPVVTQRMSLKWRKHSILHATMNIQYTRQYLNTHTHNKNMKYDNISNCRMLCYSHMTSLCCIFISVLTFFLQYRDGKGTVALFYAKCFKQ